MVEDSHNNINNNNNNRRIKGGDRVCETECVRKRETGSKKIQDIREREREKE